MKSVSAGFMALFAAFVLSGSALAADPHGDTIRLFKNAGESGKFFEKSYGYAVFPNIGKGGLGIGAAFGKGRVYEKGRLVGDVSLTQLSVGLQAGGQAFSEMIFFEDKGSFDEFTSGNFEFGADIGAVAITASANASASTEGGASAGASGDKKDAVATGGFHSGVAVFTIAKGGLMYQAAVGGQKFSYKPRGRKN